MNKEAFAELIFSVILDQSPDDRKYEEVPSVDHFYDAAMQVIEDYNATHQNKMSIVLFKWVTKMFLFPQVLNQLNMLTATL